MKFVVLSLLVVACSAVPSYNYGFSAPSVLKYGSSYGSQYLAAPRIGLVGLSGYSGLSGLSGYSGLSAGLLGNSYGLRSGIALQPATTLLAAAPALTTSYAAPAISLAAAPAISVAAAPAISVAAAPAISSVSVQKVALAAPAQAQNFQGVVPAAVNQVARTYEYRAVQNVEQPINPQVVEVEPSDNPVHLHFKTRSSTLTTSQSHTAAAPTEVQTASAQDEPQRLITEVQKPVIQEVRESILPYRQVTQEINPVQESLHTIVTKGEQQRQQYVAQQYVAQAAPAQVAVQQVAAPVAVAAPAVQAVAVEAAPAVSYQQIATPVAVQAIATPAISTGYTQTIAAPAYSTGYTQTIAAPLSTSYSQTVAAPASSFRIQKQSSVVSSGY